MHKPLDITGEKFHYFTVLSLHSHRINGISIRDWKCQCACGKIKYVKFNNLKAGRVKSCGCMAYVSGHSNRKYAPQEASLRAKAANCKAHAKLDGREWSLTLDEAAKLISGNCFYCGRPPHRLYNSMKNRSKIGADKIKDLKLVATGTILINGIDRKNNDIGYTKQNCVSCCTPCNTEKSVMAFAAFMRRKKCV